MSRRVTTDVREATDDDALAVSGVILKALRQSNAKDYSPGVIERVEASFIPSAVLNLFKQRKVFVALHDQRIVGTASLDGNTVRTMFVAPDVQRQGVGRRLIEAVEAAARIARVEVLVVPSSVTAEQFYARLGFQAVCDSFHGEERTVIMERTLTNPDPCTAVELRGTERPQPEIGGVTSNPSTSTHVVHISAAARRPAYWKLAAHLWGLGCNIDSDGNSRTPDDEEWTELTLSLRGEPGQSVTVDPITDQPATLVIRSSDPALAEKVAAFLDGSRR